MHEEYLQPELMTRLHAGESLMKTLTKYQVDYMVLESQCCALSEKLGHKFIEMENLMK